MTGYYLRSLIGSNEVCFVGLIETMIEDISRMEVNRLIGMNWDFFHFPAMGKSGGLLMLWRRDISQFVVDMSMDQAVVGSLILFNQQKWIVAIVYANKNYHTLRVLWKSIGPLISYDLPMIVGGDFNCCLNQNEKKGGRRFSYSVGAQKMVDFQVENDLHDLGFVGPRYTWSNNKSGNSKIWVRLDRILMNSEGLRMAPMVSVKHLLRLASDHCPLLLNFSPTSPRPGIRWLRFEDIWMTYPITWKLVWKNWTKLDFGQLDDVLNRKCSHTLKALFFWSRNKLRELGELKTSLEGRIEELQLQESMGEGLSNEQDEELCQKAAELNSTLARLATWWRQRAKARWIEEGDANSHFFHASASARRRGNRIAQVNDSDGNCIIDLILIQEEFLHFL
ncbi:uncharacterized protein LOC110098107 [Dendrobium catenatum]|uniref:uncharacterized protein LOC110098107 n=1 Tax=Dendrobium catenatum TaxID=906689 RepID=UPI0009F64786|nr:uncharacterized protein LOC110098107 [Dendrobium catenatum]